MTSTNLFLFLRWPKKKLHSNDQFHFGQQSNLPGSHCAQTLCLPCRSNCICTSQCQKPKCIYTFAFFFSLNIGFIVQFRSMTTEVNFRLHFREYNLETELRRFSRCLLFPQKWAAAREKSTIAGFSPLFMRFWPSTVFLSVNKYPQLDSSHSSQAMLSLLCGKVSETLEWKHKRDII